MPWGEISAVESRAGATSEDESTSKVHVCFYASEIAARLCRLYGPNLAVSSDAQSEPVVANWDLLVAALVAGSHRRPLPPTSGRKDSEVFAGRVERSPQVAVRERSAAARSSDPESRCSAIVEYLQRPDLEHEERRKLILEAEVLPFRGQHAAALAPLLRQFIETYHESNVPADLVAVGSAIRNYVATATADEAFEAAACLLKAQGRLPIPIELEVEVTKMVVRKLTANPPAERDRYPGLALRLEELVDAYARPRFLAREKHGAVALNAILGLLLTRSGRDSEVVERMRALGVPWFQQIVARRAALLRSDLIARDSDAKFADIARVLGQLSELDSPSRGS